jgi:hypothetical protein
VLGLGMGNSQKRLLTHRCEMANQRQQASRRKMVGGLTSSFFGQMRCRKSPARGFSDVLNPLALFSQPFEDFFCRFFTIEV